MGMGGGNANNNSRWTGSQQNDFNSKRKMNNSGKLPKKLFINNEVVCFLDQQNIGESSTERKQLLAQLHEISVHGDRNDGQLSTASSYNKQPTSANPSQPTNSQDEEGEEGEISESD